MAIPAEELDRLPTEEARITFEVALQVLNFDISTPVVNLYQDKDQGATLFPEVSNDVESPKDAVTRFQFFRAVLLELVKVKTDGRIDAADLLRMGFEKYSGFLQEYGVTDETSLYALNMLYGSAIYELGNEQQGIEIITNTPRPVKKPHNESDLEMLQRAFATAEVNGDYNSAIVDIAEYELHRNNLGRAQELYTTLATAQFNSSAARYYKSLITYLACHDLDAASRLIEGLQSTEFPIENAAVHDMAMVDTISQFIKVSAEQGTLDAIKENLPKIGNVVYKSLLDTKLAEAFALRDRPGDHYLAVKILRQTIKELDDALKNDQDSDELFSGQHSSIGNIGWKKTPSESRHLTIDQALYSRIIRHISKIVTQSPSLCADFPDMVLAKVDKQNSAATASTPELIDITADEYTNDPVRSFDKYWKSLRDYLYQTEYKPDDYDLYLASLRLFHSKVMQSQNNSDTNILEDILGSGDNTEGDLTVSVGNWTFSTRKGINEPEEDYIWKPSPFYRLLAETSVRNSDFKKAAQLVTSPEMIIMDKIRIVLLMLEELKPI